MLMSTALGVPRFSMMSDRRSSSPRLSRFPKLARARRAETTMVPFLPVVVGVVDINSPFQLHELYRFPEGQSMTLAHVMGLDTLLKRVEARASIPYHPR